jgi:hypothetical protein
MLILIQSSFIIASIAILWRSTLNKKPNLGKFLKKTFPAFLGTALTCGLCFTYWVALGFVLFYNPLPFDFFTFNDFICYKTIYFSHIFLSWMFIGFVAVFFRFLYVFLQEKVNYIYSLNNGGVHNH